MVVTRSGMDTHNSSMEPSDSGPSGTTLADPPSPVSPSPAPPSSLDTVVRTMMEMMLKQDEQRLAAEREKEARRLAFEEERLTADREERRRMHELISSMMSIRAESFSAPSIDYRRSLQVGKENKRKRKKVFSFLSAGLKSSTWSSPEAGWIPRMKVV